MQVTQGNVLHTLLAVRRFLADNGAKLGTVVTTGSVQKLNDAITQLDALIATQGASNVQAKGATRKQEALKKALVRDHMTKIARIAAAELPATPEITVLRMPRGRPTVAQLAAAAQGMAGAVGQFASVFTDFGVTPGFVAELQAAARDMVAAQVQGSQHKGTRGAATKGLKLQLAHGRKIVRVLDAFVRSALKDDHATLAAWESVKRVAKSTRTPTLY